MTRRCDACQVQWEGDYLSPCWSCGQRSSGQGEPILNRPYDQVAQHPDRATQPV